MKLHPDQLRIVILGVLAVILAALCLHWSDSLLPQIAAAEDVDRIAFVAPWLIPPAIALLAGILTAALLRFLSDARDGRRTGVGHMLEVTLRYNLNTLEQFALASVAWINLTLILPTELLNVIPMLSVLFVAGRIAFWAGYIINPILRAFGMVLTVVPTIVCYSWIAIRMLLP